jgi:hypothetical protein
MNLTLLIGPIVFVVVFTAAWAACPWTPKSKRKDQGPAFLPPIRGQSDTDQSSVPEFKSTWKDFR